MLLPIFCVMLKLVFFMLVLQKNPVPYLVPCSVISPFATVSEAWGVPCVSDPLTCLLLTG